MLVAPSSTLEVINSRIQKHLLLLLLGAYFVGAILPSIGIALHETLLPRISLGTFLTINVSMPSLLLGFILLSAGFGLDLKSNRNLGGNVPLLVSSIALNCFLPLLVAAVSFGSTQLVGQSPEAQAIAVAFTIVASVPIAGSSTAWAQTSGGSISFSLALIIFSTLLGPLLSPFIFSIGSQFSSGGYRNLLKQIASHDALPFFVLAIVIPTLLGVILRASCPADVRGFIKTGLRFLSLGSLLLLNYANAALALPKVFSQPNFDQLLGFAGVTTLLCLTTFFVGWWLPRALSKKPDKEIRISTAFGLGMNNNGAGLVIASAFMREEQLILVLLLIYNLTQQLFAALFHSYLDRYEANAPLTPS
jgi:BASS family bile acid:Na+ symporter